MLRPSGESSRSIVAVPTCQCLIQLQTGRRYLIYVRAVNIGGPSDRSEVITVSTTGEQNTYTSPVSAWSRYFLVTSNFKHILSNHSSSSWLLAHWACAQSINRSFFAVKSRDGQPGLFPSRYILLPPRGHCPPVPFSLRGRLHYILWRRGAADQCYGLRWQHLHQVGCLRDRR